MGFMRSINKGVAFVGESHTIHVFKRGGMWRVYFYRSGKFSSSHSLTARQLMRFGRKLVFKLEQYDIKLTQIK